MKNPRSSHGGARPGAGRKRSVTPGAVRVTITLPPHLLALARELGGGRVSEGVRLALAQCALGAAIPRELQIWQHVPTASYWLIAWRDVLLGARKAASLAHAHELAALQRGQQWDADATDWLDAEYSAGRVEIVWRQYPEDADA